ncbi:MAG: laccase domain-containing protein, partial [Psychrobacter sp.]|nr:laccase domain-containing protein [Psychrobacter sp.]
QVSTEVASKLVESCLSLGLVNALSFKLLYQQITDDTVAQSGQTLAQQPSAKTQLDLRKLTRLQLDHLGINLAADEQIACSYGDRRYYSYRQQTHEGRPATGRMAMIIAKR